MEEGIDISHFPFCVDKSRFTLLRESQHVSALLCERSEIIFKFSDVDDIKFVINYDYPNNSEDYVHRIGRTGRRDKKVIRY